MNQRNHSVQPSDRLEKIYKSKLDLLLRPVCHLFLTIGLSPNSISNIRGILAISALLTMVSGYHIAGAVVFIIALILDSIDGGMARLLRNITHQGKFIDKIVDYIVYYASVLAMIWMGGIGAFAGSYHIAITGMAALLKVVAENEGKSTDWIINPQPNMVWLMILWYGFFLVYLLFSRDWMNDVIFWLNVILTFVALQSFFAIQRRWSLVGLQRRGRR